MDIREIIGGFVAFILGVYILGQLTQALAFPSGSLIVSLFIIGGIIWFIRQVLGR